MTFAWAVTGWVCTLAAIAVATLSVRRLRTAESAAARCVHELRGGLCAARLGLHALSRDPSPAALAAVELQLCRAGRALDSLDGTPSAEEELVDVSALVADVVEAWSPLGDVTLERREGPLLVRGDRVALAQACGNLVGNALEHGSAPVAVRARAAGERVRIEVLDGGSGLPATVAELVAAARHRRTRRGHGLAIAADVVARHGGRLSSAPAGSGTRMIVDLPRSPQALRAIG